MSECASTDQGGLPSSRRKGRAVRVIAGLVVICLGVVLACTVHLSSPEGAFYDPDVGCEGDAYWVFHGGEFRLRTPESDELISTYAKKESGWVYHSVRDSTGQFTFTAKLLGITLHDSSSQGPDRFMFRRSFAWLPKAWTWIQ